jgi:GNAT-family acetyltransferase (TIGR03103 family)
MERSNDLRERLERITSPTLKNWQAPAGPEAAEMKADAFVDMGWGRILFGHTYSSPEALCAALLCEREGHRDIAVYLRDPHVLLSIGPEQLFLDPSHTFRLWRHDYRPGKHRPVSLTVRRLSGREDAQAVNRIYAARHMVVCDPGFLTRRNTSRLRTCLVAEQVTDGRIIGSVTGVDHVEAFADPENGASLWSLAVDPQAQMPGAGEILVRQLAERFFTRGRNYLDLSVMHDNKEAIALYEKIGFQRVPVFCVKRKNGINEPLFTGGDAEDRLNPYARIITTEARRRGIDVEVLDQKHNYFRLQHGGRAVTCRESLSELTSAIAMSRCDDKRLTHRVLKSAGVNVPRQVEVNGPVSDDRILEKIPRVVVKPARGEQGDGVSVDVRTPRELQTAVHRAKRFCPDVIIEEYIEGEDLRVIVIDQAVVAAAVRRPPSITGSGRHTVEALVDKYNRRRASATGGESRVPLDEETLRSLSASGLKLDSIPEAGQTITLRKTANLHTGGTIHDVTDRLHPDLRAAAVDAARALSIPVTGLDMIVSDVEADEYALIEANERPGLANHEPQPTARRFVDLLFPQTAQRN